MKEKEIGTLCHNLRWAWRQTRALAAELEPGIPDMLFGRSQDLDSSQGFFSASIGSPTTSSLEMAEAPPWRELALSRVVNGDFKSFPYTEWLGRACRALCSEWPGGRSLIPQGSHEYPCWFTVFQSLTLTPSSLFFSHHLGRPVRTMKRFIFFLYKNPNRWGFW